MGRDGTRKARPSAMSLDGLIDVGSHYVTQTDIPTAGVITVKITNVADAGKTIRFNGRMPTGAEIVDNPATSGKT